MSVEPKKLPNYDNMAITYDNDNNETMRVYTRNGKKHKSDGPAVVYANGDVEYWYEGKLCRIEDETLPAVDKVDLKKWYTGGVPHRVGGPAIIAYKNVDWREAHELNLYIYTSVFSCYEGGYEMWMKNGKRHRVGGPATVSSTGNEGAWYLHGLGHRINGPILCADGDSKWFFKDNSYKTEAEHHAAVNKYKLEVAETLGYDNIDNCFCGHAETKTVTETDAASEKTSGKFKLLLDGKVVYVDSLQILTD
jgi:hypothetical protein